MPAQAFPLDSRGPGWACIRISGRPECDPATLEIAIEQPSTGSFMQPYGVATPWATSKTWLAPEEKNKEGELIQVTLSPQLTWHLKANVTYLLHIRDASSEVPGAERLPWRAIRLPSTPPVPLREEPQEPAKSEEVKAPDQHERGTEPEKHKAEPVAKTEEAQRETSVTRPNRFGTKTGRPPRKGLVGALLVLLLLLAAAGGVLWYFGIQSRKDPETVAAAVPPAESVDGKLTVETARLYVRSQADPAASVAEAERYMAAGTPEAVQGALVIYTEAAKAGSSQAATAIGKMYDPETFMRDRSAVPAEDSEKALLWYQRAADGNDAEGLYRLGKLLLRGRVEEPGLGPEAGVRALERAARLGHAEAKAELAKLSGSH